jgi:hypothetical protein
MSKSEKLQQLEKRFNLAENLIEELSTTIDEISTTEIELASETDLQTLSPDEEKILSVTNLKQDFLLIRNNLIKLIHTGQRILDSASCIDISDMKASQLDALSNLQATLGNNMQMLISLYKDLAGIEKSRQKPVPKAVQENSGTINTTNNVVFQGNSSDLLRLLNQQNDPISIN